MKLIFPLFIQTCEDSPPTKSLPGAGAVSAADPDPASSEAGPVAPPTAEPASLLNVKVGIGRSKDHTNTLVFFPEK